MFKVRLTKIENNHNELRDDSIEGETSNLPKIGRQFVMFGPPRDINIGHRMVNTSAIDMLSLDDDGKIYIVGTISGSIYKIEHLDD